MSIKTKGWPDGDDLIEMALSWDRAHHKSHHRPRISTAERFRRHRQSEIAKGKDFDPSPRWNRMRGWHYHVTKLLKQRQEYRDARTVFVNGRRIEKPMPKELLLTV
jgi:hypothetical protein